MERSIIKKKHQQIKKSEMMQDENHVNAMVEHVKCNRSNPFDVSINPDDKWRNIATGMHASDKIKISLLSAITLGQDKFLQFIEERLEELSSKTLYQPITRSGILTLSEMKKA